MASLLLATRKPPTLLLLLLTCRPSSSRTKAAAARRLCSKHQRATSCTSQQQKRAWTLAHAGCMRWVQPQSDHAVACFSWQLAVTPSLLSHSCCVVRGAAIATLLTTQHHSQACSCSPDTRHWHLSLSLGGLLLPCSALATQNTLSLVHQHGAVLYPQAGKVKLELKVTDKMSGDAKHYVPRCIAGTGGNVNLDATNKKVRLQRSTAQPTCGSTVAVCTEGFCRHVSTSRSRALVRSS